MYLLNRILNHEKFFNGICEIKENPEILKKNLKLLPFNFKFN